MGRIDSHNRKLDIWIFYLLFVDKGIKHHICSKDKCSISSTLGKFNDGNLHLGKIVT